MAAEILEWVDAGGVAHSLVDYGRVGWLEGARGRWMPPFRLVEEAVPFQPGSKLRQVNVQPREVDIPLLFQHTSLETQYAQLEEVLRWFNPLRGDGKLRATNPNGAQRELVARYIGGLELQESFPESGLTWQRAVITLRAFEPYWQDVVVTEETFTAAAATPFFPFPPLVLAGSAVFASPIVTNDGDAESWPTWTITGPGTTPVLENLTTGKSLTLDLTLAAGDTLTIDTRPGQKTVLDQNDTSQFMSLDPTSELWPLAQGDNALSIEMPAATGATSVTLSYKRRWLSP